MQPKHILALNGHPADNSLSAGLIASYQSGAEKAGHQVKRHNLADMIFDPDHGDGGYKHSKPLEAPLQAFVEDLKWCDHIVIATPLWWGGIPSKLKGLFDRTLLPGIAFDTRNKNALGVPAPLLTGKTGSILLTSDTPSWALSVFYNTAIKKQMERQILKFVGIKPKKFKNFAPATDVQTETAEKWLKSTHQMGLSAS